MIAKRLLGAASLIALLAGLAAVALPLVGTATGRLRLLPILSGSMAPHMPTGSLAVATPTPTRSVRAGEVIVFAIPIGDHHVTAHRVVRIVRAGLHPVVQTRGDANGRPDPWRARLDGTTVWRVRGAIPFLGYAAVFAGRARFLLLALVALIPLGICLRLLLRHDREAVIPTRAAGSV